MSAQADRRVTREDTFWTIGYFCGTAHKIEYDDLVFFRSVAVGFPKCWYQKTRPHTAVRTIETSNLFVWEQLAHPLYCPDLSSSDFLLFIPHLKDFLRWRKKYREQMAKNSIQRFLVFSTEKNGDCFERKKKFFSRMNWVVWTAIKPVVADKHPCY